MNHRSVKKCLIAAIVGGIPVANAGDSVVVPRRSFRESKTYPHIFQPEGYLAGSGPMPMHIEQRPAAFSKRTAPPLPDNAKGKEKPLPPLDPKDEQADTATEKVIHVGKKKDDLPLPEPDLGKVPEAVLRFFRDRDGQPQALQPNLFDPIFQPARASELPKSKATYVQKP